MEETVDTTLSHCLQVCEQLKSDRVTVVARSAALETRAPFSQHPSLKHIEADIREEVLADFVA